MNFSKKYLIIFGLIISFGNAQCMFLPNPPLKTDLCTVSLVTVAALFQLCRTPHNPVILHILATSIGTGTTLSLLANNTYPFGHLMAWGLVGAASFDFLILKD
ncbi:hypothetical protein IPH25_03725 [bacterium]|nr:MAG: hypothetical protein IPG37_00720 [bacterium]QQR61562.1 MAG: hypothetical protein IPH25_03725 [bacterium]QQR62904.1 MAG: hypothetical protein IPH67_00230 [bacterium]